MNKEKRRKELLKQIAEANSMEEIRKLQEEIEKLDKEPEENELNENIGQEEERNLIRNTSNNIREERSMGVSRIFNGGTEIKKEEKKYTTASPEYRTAWAKTLMGKKLDDVEERALGDALGTTATTFVASAADTQGINNLGLLIPDSVRMDWMKMIEEQSPIYRDITKLHVPGNVDLPYLFAADDAEWYVELTSTKNEGQKYKNLKLTGHELSKAIEITWKAESMTVEGFISFLLQELNKKMNTALITAVIYADGSNKPTGITDGLTPEKNSNPIELIKKLLGALSNEDRVGAKVYVASDIADEISFYKDANGNYPYLLSNGLGKAGGSQIEMDPFLKAGDVIAGNCSNYILNFNEDLRVDKEIKLQPRRVVYGGYLIADGNKKPNAFKYGQVTATTTTQTIPTV